MKPFKPREGDFIESHDKLILAVKGLVHPPDRVVAYTRYAPDPNGNRSRDKETYQKVYPLTERWELLQRKYPHYMVFNQVFGEYISEVPVKSIRRHYSPSNRLTKLRRDRRLDPVEALALEFIECLRKWTGIAWNKLGVSGSILVRLHLPSSDIDVIVYGTRNCLLAYETLKKIFTVKRTRIKAFDLEDLEKIYETRKEDLPMSLNDFLKAERRKVLQGKFRGRDFFIRFVKDWDEVQERYGEIRYTGMGYAKIVARVIDDSDAIFTPCRYGLDRVQVLKGRKIGPIRELVSFRGGFCEQARFGEIVEAQGKLEKVKPKDGAEYYRLLLGGNPTDYMTRGGVS